MDDFQQYISNTAAAVANNYILSWDEEKTITCRSYFKLLSWGTFQWKFWFSNAVDSTFDDGALAYANRSGGRWRILSAEIADGGENVNEDLTNLTPIMFGGGREKDVLPDEEFWSDEAILTVPEGHYLVFQWTISGNDIPTTSDNLIPTFVRYGEAFQEDMLCPKPNLVACDRPVRTRVAFLGDSITQGLGTAPDRYEYWAARIAAGLGDAYSVWNLGLGFGRAYDAASDGAWLRMARRSDAVFICFGVNDILRGRSAEQIRDDLLYVATQLRQAGCHVVLASIPPFDLEGGEEAVWRKANAYIEQIGTEQRISIFPMAQALGQAPPLEHRSLYGSHPDGRGGAKVAELFFQYRDRWGI